MSKKYFPEYVFPMVDDELLKREPDGQDNPYFIMEHILACRKSGVVEDWHEDYIDKILAGILKDSIDTELGIYKGKGKDSDRYRWRQYHEKIDMNLDAHRLYEVGRKFDPYKGYESLSHKGIDGMYVTLGEIYGITKSTIKSIFDKSKLPPKRTPLEDRKKDKK